MTTPSGRLGRIVSRWEGLWFAEVPGDLYALLRIAVGTVGFLCVLSLLPVSTFWTPDGLMPVPGPGGFKAWLIAIGLGGLVGWALLLSILAAFGCMIVGYRTTSAVVACFVLSVVHQRLWNPLPLSGAHHVVAISLFCLVWADCSGSPSVDAWLSRRNGARPASLPGSLQAIGPLRLIRFHIAWIYFTTGLWKFISPNWRDGSAIHYVLNVNIFARFPYDLPASLEWAATLATYVTLFWELLFPFLLLHRWTRRLALILGVSLHLGMAVSMELGMFSWAMLVAYLAFVDPVQYARLRHALFEPRSRATTDTAPVQRAAAQPSNS